MLKWNLTDIRNELCKMAQGATNWHKTGHEATPDGNVTIFHYCRPYQKTALTEALNGAQTNNFDSARVLETPTGLKIEYHILNGGIWDIQTTEVTRTPLVTPVQVKNRTPTERKLDISLRKACYASTPKDYDKIKTLLDQGADPNAKSGINSFGFDSTALSNAMLDGDPKTVKLLLDHGADVNWINNTGETIIHAFLQSSYRRDLKTFEILLNSKFRHFSHKDGSGVPLREYIGKVQTISMSNKLDITKLFTLYDIAERRSKVHAMPTMEF